MFGEKVSYVTHFGVYNNTHWSVSMCLTQERSAYKSSLVGIWSRKNIFTKQVASVSPPHITILWLSLLWYTHIAANQTDSSSAECSILSKEGNRCLLYLFFNIRECPSVLVARQLTAKHAFLLHPTSSLCNIWSKLST